MAGSWCLFAVELSDLTKSTFRMQSWGFWEAIEILHISLSAGGEETAKMVFS